MKQFFKFAFASMLGFFLSILVIIFLLVGLVAGIAGSFGERKETQVKEGSILRVSLNYSISERTPKNPFENFNFGDHSDEEDKALGLNDIIENIRKAKTDEHIKGIFLDISMMPNGMATLEEIRNALMDFKQSKKFIYAYAEIYTEGGYYLASVADKIYINPAGDMLFNGMTANMTYMKSMLDKIGVEAQVIKHGKFKSAAESLVQDKMSDENRKQVEEFVGAMYRHYMAQIALARHKEVAEVMSIADELKIQSVEEAKALGMIDEIKYRDEVIEALKSKLKLKKDDKINFVTLGGYNSVSSKVNASKNKIAVIYAIGDINGGEGDDESIGSDRLARAIKKAREDKNIKAIVLRVNSPGGSALASDVIWREMMLTKGVKPLIVSMGNVAASGGYYISLAADTIVAQPNTITGSIGVIGVLLNAQKLLNDKLGVHLDGVKFGKYADLGRADRPLSADERAIIQKAIDRIYEDFITKVATTRHKTTAEIDSIAQGRVWAGTDALRIGLVDVLGGMDKAIEIAAKKAGLKEYKITSLPDLKDPLQELMKSFGTSMKEQMLKAELKENYQTYHNMIKLMNMQGLQTRMPFEIVIE
jgi:protease-4